ncbi:amylo-alpha-1,6-glucosidase [Caldovatus aquaticus]|uniref:Amylo-alpha-1,6-glucosidase n=1 Tax=Caldovatus aquaticus TaxID=2865671 RepID=A0ABS7F461_9PROT|nr:amylo-alpha-1,6-glucosidase [Caldovatus aquaticus]MBW8270405.1 amylo-alpha-1,6-glucosidase [Caldovatus aquaticus]
MEALDTDAAAPETAPVRPEAGGAPSFSVAVTAATALALYRPRTLKCQDSFAVLDHFGDMQALHPTAEGLFHADTRYLSRLALRIGNERPLLLSSSVSEDNALLSVNLTNPDMVPCGTTQLPRDTLYLRRVMALGEGVLRERLTLRNFGSVEVACELALGYAADFADIFEVRGGRRPRRGESLPPEATEEGGAVLGYRGLDGVTRRTRLDFVPRPDAHRLGSEARWTLRLPPGGQQVIEIVIRCSAGAEAAPPPPEAPTLEALISGHRAWSERRQRETAHFHTSNESFNDWVNRSRADLDMLTTDTPEGPFPYAGIPWFSSPFGRDSLITALQCLWLDPGLARGVLRFLAARQATGFDPERDAEPGKILHEMRGGEMAALGEVPFGLYYGSVDSTPLFVMLAAAYWDRTGDLALIRALWPNIEAALGWMERHGDRDGDGFLEYHRLSSKGLVNQGWKDSHDAIFHADGSTPEGPIALVEVQAYAYAAWSGAARLAAALGRKAQARSFAERAATLRRRFEEAFWCEDLGTYALALDGAKRPCRVRSSNAGHALLVGIAAPERAARVAATLLDRDSFSGWGVRTIARGEARYNPMSYHNGSVWPHDNGLIALGLARYGLREPLVRLLGALFDAALFADLKRLPELYCGFERRAGEGPTGYPVACLPQAWASAAAFAVLGAMLGIGFDPAHRQLRFVRPVLPPWLEVVRLYNLRLGAAAVDVRLNRHAGDNDVALNVLRRRGRIEVAVIT